jgi:hypothetical protein
MLSRKLTICGEAFLLHRRERSKAIRLRSQGMRRNFEGQVPAAKLEHARRLCPGDLSRRLQPLVRIFPHERGICTISPEAANHAGLVTALLSAKCRQILSEFMNDPYLKYEQTDRVSSHA